MATQPRPPELQLEGCVIRTSYGTGGKVIAVTGPYPPEVNGVFPDVGGYSITYIDPIDGSTCWINDVFVEGGRIYAYEWKEEIHVVGHAQEQLKLF